MEPTNNFVKDFVEAAMNNDSFFSSVYKENKLAFITMSGIIYIEKVPETYDKVNKVFSLQFKKVEDQIFRPSGVFPFFILTELEGKPSFMLVVYPEIILDTGVETILVPFKVLEIGDIKNDPKGNGSKNN